MESRPRVAVVSSLLMFVLFVFGGLLIGGTLGQLAAWLWLPNASFADTITLSSAPSSFENGRWALLTLQGVSMTVGFGILPWIFVKYTDPLRSYFQNNKEKVRHNAMLFTLAALITLVSMPFILFIGTLNQSMQLPDFLSGLENWMRNKEDSIAELTRYITAFDSHWQFAFGLLIVAVLPGIAEEYCFRGILQKRLRLLFSNPHVAIVLAAVVFSAIHVQFYGFLPRFLLGAMFGYLFYWSGNLKVAMFAHFVNNAAALFAVYLSGTQEMLENPAMQEVESMPTLIGSAAVSLVLCGFLLHYFYKISTQNNAYPSPSEQD
ncbi:MAG: CPBP family intramembrane metalloprotease [Bernardetiaceae bacterium]|nr:CPBP family intramembrane metalloprotease [Bernardetiaceae bacterium]